MKQEPAATRRRRYRQKIETFDIHQLVGAE